MFTVIADHEPVDPLLSGGGAIVTRKGAWEEYDAAADWCAARGLAGKVGDSRDPEAFEDRVRASAYARAMERKGGNMHFTVTINGRTYPMCEECLASPNIPYGQEDLAVQQLVGKWLCQDHLKQNLNAGIGIRMLGH